MNGPARPTPPPPGGPGAGPRRLRAPVPSPCISVCRIDPDAGLCEGCSRTLDEIARWGGMDDDAKRAVWRLLPARGGPTLVE